MTDTALYIPLDNASTRTSFLEPSWYPTVAVRSHTLHTHCVHWVVCIVLMDRGSHHLEEDSTTCIQHQEVVVVAAVVEIQLEEDQTIEEVDRMKGPLLRDHTNTIRARKRNVVHAVHQCEALEAALRCYQTKFALRQQDRQAWEVYQGILADIVHPLEPSYLLDRSVQDSKEKMVGRNSEEEDPGTETPRVVEDMQEDRDEEELLIDDDTGSRQLRFLHLPLWA